MPDPEPLWLQNQLCFALYAATNAIVRSYRTRLGEMGLTYPQYLVLVTLIERPSMTSGELAKALRLDAGTLTPMLKRLTAAGLIERSRRVKDERIIDNRLSAKGLALQDRLMQAQAEVKCRTGLAEDEITTLRGVLQQLGGNLAASTGEDLQTV